MNRKQLKTLVIITILVVSLFLLTLQSVPAAQIITNPKIKPNAPDSVNFQEDEPPQYIDLYDIYDDTTKSLTFTLWTGTTWGTSFSNENLTVDIKANDTLKFSPLPNMDGVDSILVNATNTYNLSTIHKITVTIKAVNDPPVIEWIGNIKVDKLDSVSIFAYQNEWYNVTVVASDLDGDAVIYLDNTTLFDINYLTGNISFLPTQDDVGVTFINITASDVNGTNNEDRMNVKFTILNTNDPPTAMISYPENGSVIYSEKYMVFEGKADDPDIMFGDSITYYWTSDLDGFLGDSAEIHVYQLSVGTHKITFNVTDAMGVSDEDNITVIVKANPWDTNYHVELEMEEDTFVIKQNEVVVCEVVVSNFGRRAEENITFEVNNYFDFPGTVEYEFENITLESRESHEFNVTISAPEDCKIGFYLLELKSKSSFSEKMDNNDINNTNDYYPYGYEGSVEIRVVVIDNKTEEAKAEKPNWELDDYWEYSMDMRMDEITNMSGTTSMKIAEDTTKTVNDKDYAVFGLYGESLLNMEISPDGVYSGTMDMTINGTNYLEKSNLAQVMDESRLEYSYDMMGEEWSFGSITTSTYDPPFDSQNFPIKSGEQWTVTTKVEERTQTIENYDGSGDSYTDTSIEKRTMTYICIGTEVVTVPAGTFDSFITLQLDMEIEYDYGWKEDPSENPKDSSGNGYGSGTRQSVTDLTGGEAIQITYYSPEVGNSVKIISYTKVYNYDDFNYGQESYTWEESMVLELESFSYDGTTTDQEPDDNDDLDNDTLPDVWEDIYNVDDPKADDDMDGFTNLDEYENGTNPMDKNDTPDDPIDEDSDGLPDTWEREHGLDPNDPSDAKADLDNDGFPNDKEYEARTSPSDSEDHPTTRKRDNDDSGSGGLIFIYIFIIIGVVIFLVLFMLMARRNRSKRWASYQPTTQVSSPEQDARVHGVPPPHEPYAQPPAPLPIHQHPPEPRAPPQYQPPQENTRPLPPPPDD
jgi:hypothetical protein